jgi:anti-sigma regulatory factor (Ser/Thr protein kinase)
VSQTDSAGGSDVVPLPANADAPHIARTFVRAQAGELDDQLIDDALILVSELVTNAVDHGHEEITLYVRVHPPGIGVAVKDEGVGRIPAEVVAPAAAAASGRGLLIVDALASSWGVTPVNPPPGKTVWFELNPT